MTFDFEKFCDVVWFICASCDDPAELGRVKLHKTLYFSDMMSFLGSGQPLTGEQYQKQKFGPTAKNLQKALKALEKNNRIEISERDYFGYKKQDFNSQMKFESNRLSDEEKEIVRDVLDWVRGKSAREMSELSHNDAWHTAQMGEVLPYFSAHMMQPSEVTDADISWATAEAKNVIAARA